MLQLRLQTLAESAEDIEALLFSCGAVSVSLEDAADEPILEPSIGDHPLWSKIFIQGHFITDEGVQLACKALENNPHIEQQIVLKQIQEQDWQANFQQQFSAKQFGPLWIYPSWEQNPAPDGLTLQLDPGLAFGTGHHATTSLCLNWLGAASLQDQTIIDFGCGSGILALAAHRIGAKHVYAVDIDPQALIAIRENIDSNNLNQEMFTVGNVDCLTNISSDIIIANILAAPLLELRDTFFQRLKPHGTLVISGILQTQIDMISQHYAAYFQVQQTFLQEEWACVALTKLS